MTLDKLPFCLFVTCPQFIGELGKLEILSESILHRCIQQLLSDKKKNRGGGSKDMAEDLECLSQIMRTCGRILDSDKGKVGF
jgi:translation initiation factor 4G